MGRSWRAAVAALLAALAAVAGGVWLVGRSGPAGLPAESGEWPEFAMLFEQAPGGGESWRLLWVDPGNWRLERSRGAGVGFAPVQATYALDGITYRLAAGAPGPEVVAGATGPFAWLGEQLSPLQAWVRARPDAGAEPVPADPIHPLAAYAADDGSVRMEVTAEGIPVLVEMGPDGPAMRALSIERRRVSADEIRAALGDYEAVPGVAPQGEVLRVTETGTMQGLLVARDGCLDVIVESTEGDLLGRVGGCGLPAVGPAGLTVSGGGVAGAAGTWVEVHHGSAGAEVARVEVTYGDGTVRVDDGVEGLWLTLGPAGAPRPERPTVARAFDAAGQLVATVETAAP